MQVLDKQNPLLASGLYIFTTLRIALSFAIEPKFFQVNQFAKERLGSLL
ncbi:hypothetical protein VCR15J2_360045 [Vibrio coralliirubri]|nr:hypothetical protein VCR15J2_360045 [Vibrio coralliirubri]